MTRYELSEYGTHIIMGVSGPALNDHDIRLLETVRPAGILFLKRNIIQDSPYQVWLEAFAKLISDIQKRCGRDKMIFSIDHEGGQVQRTPAPITNFGRPVNYARRAAEVAKAMAIELASLGVNLSWAPLCDVNTNPENPIIGKLGRAFSDSAQNVAECALAFHQAMIAQKVLTCAKHFPGHGQTWSDSHLELPTVDTDENELFARELAPFKALIDAGVPTIMTAHVMFPKIDPANPATLSDRIIAGILREKLAYDRVVIADDVNMKAVADRFQTQAAVAQSMQAGVDMFLVARFPDADSDHTPHNLAEFIAVSIEQGALDLAVVNASKKRIKSLLKSAVMHKAHPLEQNIFDAHGKIAAEINPPPPAADTGA